MIQIISKFKIAAKSFFNKDRPYNKPLRIIIPVSILLIAGITVGVLYFVDYSKSPVLTLSNVSSSKPTETNKSSFSVNGQIDELKDTELFINGSKVKIDGDGSFIYSINLVEGKNEVEFRLVKNGKEVKNVYTINRNIEKTEAAIVKEETKVIDEVQKETNTPEQITTPQKIIVDTPIVEIKTEQPPVTPVVIPEAPKPVDVRAELSADGCTYSFYAPAGYIMSFSSFDPKYPESGENIGSITMPAEGIFVRSLDSAPFWVGVVISINIRETADGPILSSASKTVTSICGSDN